MTPVQDLKGVAQAFQAIGDKYGASARARAGLARCQLRFGGYAQAARLFNDALYLAPADRVLQQGARDAADRLRVARAALPDVPSGKRILRVEKVVFPGESAHWAVLLGKRSVSEYGSPEPELASVEVPTASAAADGDDALGGLFRATYTGLHLRLYREGTRSLVPVSPAQLLGGARIGGLCHEASLVVADLTGDGRPEITVAQVFHGASWMPSHLAIFAFQKGRLKKMLGVGSSFPVWVEDLDHDGRWEVGNYYEVGAGPHMSQPLWTDIYAYRVGRYTLANERFPREFRRWPAELRSFLRRYPDSADVWIRLGVSHQVLGSRRRAVSAYREGAKRYQAQAATAEPADRDYCRAMVGEIRRRIGRMRVK